MGDLVLGGPVSGLRLRKTDLIWLAAIPLGIYLISKLRGESEIERRVLKYKDILIDAGVRYEVPPEILAAIFHLECNGNPYCVSSINGFLSCGPIPVLSTPIECSRYLSKEGFYLGALIVSIYVKRFGLIEGLKRYASDNLGFGLKFKTTDEFIRKISALSARYAKLLRR